MTDEPRIPEAMYGVLEQAKSQVTTAVQAVAEQIKVLGYGVLESGYSLKELATLRTSFEKAHNSYIERYGRERLKKIDELNTIRALLSHSDDIFTTLALHPGLAELLEQLIVGKYILNQQNGIINPPQQPYNQGAWHRDLPYQHFVSSRPIAINALFCLDDFTVENGATFVLPGSHKYEAFPSKEFIQKNAIQVEAPAGSFVMLDCMTFHAGGFNSTDLPRRAINHVFNIPFFKQQICLPKMMTPDGLDDRAKEILGYRFAEPSTIADYLNSRER